MSEETTIYTSAIGTPWHYDIGGTTWADIREGAGTNLLAAVALKLSGGSGSFTLNRRCMLTFDTSPMSGKDIISAKVKMKTKATFSLIADPYPDTEYNIFSATPTDQLNIAASDYQSVGTVPLCNTSITWLGMPGAVEWILNSSGLAEINKTGYTTFSFCESKYDRPDIEPSFPPSSWDIIVDMYDPDEDDPPELFIIYGEFYPSVATTRVSGIIHRWEPGDRNYTMEVSLGGVTTDFGIPQIGKVQPAVPSAPLPDATTIIDGEWYYRYQCPICKAIFTTQKDLSHHIALTHLTEPLIQ
jgi:hypothetical protein